MKIELIQLWMDRKAAHNTGFASGGLTCKFEALCFYSSSVQVDSFVLRNPPERKARNRYGQLTDSREMCYVKIRYDKFEPTMLDATKEKNAKLTWRNLDYKFKFAYVTTTIPIIVFVISIFFLFGIDAGTYTEFISKFSGVAYLLMLVTALIAISICTDSIYKSYKSKDYTDFIPAIIGLFLAFFSLLIMLISFIAGALIILKEI